MEYGIQSTDHSFTETDKEFDLEENLFPVILWLLGYLNKMKFIYIESFLP